MIADWTVDVSDTSPVIVLPWENWVDLGINDALTPEASGTFKQSANSLAEAQAYPELVPLLRLGNGRYTMTAKVDVFAVTRDEVDPEIADAGLEATAHGLCSYLDVLARAPGRTLTFEDYERVARNVSRRVSMVELSAASAEIVIRPAQLYDKQAFGWTAYATGFGPNAAEARAAWARAGEVVVAALVDEVRSAIPL